jgi:hypothetical protein
MKMLELTLELNGTDYRVKQEGYAFDIEWFEWTEDSGTFTRYHTVYTHEELVRFLAEKAK